MDSTMGRLGNFGVLLCIFFCFVWQMNGDEQKMSDHEKITKNIIQSFTQQVENEFELYCVGDGGGSNESITLIFEGCRRASIEEARLLQVTITERLISAINCHKELSNYFIQFPLSHKNINIRLGFVKENSSDYSDANVAYIFTVRNKMFYCSHDVITSKLIDVYEEPYEEAVKIVHNTHIPEDLRFHKAQPYEEELDRLTFQFIKEIHHKYGFLNADWGGQTAHGIDKLAFHFVANKKVSQEKARALEIEIINKLLLLVNSNEKLRPYLKEYPFQAHSAEIKLSFQKKDGENFRYEKGTKNEYMANVHQRNNRLFYSIRPPDTKEVYFGIRALSDEPYEEALQKLQVAHK